MPTLDVSDVLISPEFADVVTVYRRAENVNIYGEAVPSMQPIPNVWAVITSRDPNDLEREDASETQRRSYSIITRFQLQGPTPGKLPDYVKFQGSYHVITNVEPYNRYGGGLVEAVMTSVDYIDPVLEAEGQTQV